MCGICGIVNEDPGRPVSREVLERMNRTMTHRGPDDEGLRMGSGAGLAMRRLAVIDVEGGRQPAVSEDGRIWAVVNGEIYNHDLLRRSLVAGGHIFHSRSDSETLPHLYEEHGEGLLSHLNGMFGIAVWDDRRRVLMLARDRMGQKPLYWARLGGVLVFASELKAIKAYGCGLTTDRASVARYLAHEYVPAPHTIFSEVRKLEPGQRLVFRDGRVFLSRYWNIPLGEEISDISEREAASRLLELLSKSVERRLISDVPLGVFLSGGIDSSTIVAMVSRQMDPRSIKTFSIAFREPSFDESSHARRVASFFGTDHREQLCTPDDLMEIMPEICGLLDEPLADNSIIPTFALSRFTRRHVTVALGGDGGDELFAGYPTFQAERLAGWYLRLPAFVRRRIVEPASRLLPASDANISFDFKVKRFLKGVERRGCQRHAVWMGAFSDREIDALMEGGLPCDVYEDVGRLEREAAAAPGGNGLLYSYMKSYLAEDILTKVDRASMGVSLEARAPFLDHEVVEFAARLPYRMKLRGFEMKRILKVAVRGLLPEGIADRPKKGFGLPVARWIKGPLKERALDLLSERRIAEQGFFRPKVVRRLLDEHMEGRADRRKEIWTLMMFQHWLEKWGS